MLTLSATQKRTNWFAIGARFQRRAESGGHHVEESRLWSRFQATIYTKLVEYFEWFEKKNAGQYPE